MAHGIKRSLIVIDDDTATIHAGADAVVEHQGHTTVDELLEMVVVHCVLGLTDDDATDLVLVKLIAEERLAVVLLGTLSHHDGISARHSLLINATKYRGEIEVLELRYDDADDLHGFCATIAQVLCNHVGDIVMLTGVLLYALALLITDAGTVFHGSRHSGHRHAKSLGDVLHGDRC